MSEILEIGSDGAYELPSETKAKPVVKPEMINPSEEAIELLLNEINSKSVFETMATSEYRIFSDNGQIKIVVKVDGNARPISVTWSSQTNELQITMDNHEQSLSVPISSDLKADMTKLTSRYSNNILIISTIKL